MKINKDVESPSFHSDLKSETVLALTSASSKGQPGRVTEFELKADREIESGTKLRIRGGTGAEIGNGDGVEIGFVETSLWIRISRLTRDINSILYYKIVNSDKSGVQYSREPARREPCGFRISLRARVVCKKAEKHYARRNRLADSHVLVVAHVDSIKVY
ncbi:hypothetical protein EVAR_59118_1 [Eumeta japonica]|uniref:Uncharacterized protein n=1 Tax=Eumeta variegata TaxID=151549 RepID=A0A4C1ZII1_EUMVA|nr:hypothetical protein EVAR_59118_1 [Eumeta japonica]